MNRKNRIAAVREVAQQIRYVCDVNSIHRFYEMEDAIKSQERSHRSGRPGGYRESVPVAVDYFIVRCFVHAFQSIQEANTITEILRSMCVRTDYLLALAIVAERSEVIAAGVDMDRLLEASELLDYTSDIARCI